MSMRQWVSPDCMVGDVVDLSVAWLAETGIRGLLVDVDNTLKSHAEEELAPVVLNWLDGVHSAGLRVSLLSNGGRDRIRRVAEQAKMPYVPQARKPWTARARTILDEWQLPREAVAIIGDQLFSDIWCGRWLGIRTILVTPRDPREPWFTRIKRPFEWCLLRKPEPLRSD